MQEGLDRHDAIHVIGSVPVGIFFDVSNDPSKQIGFPERHGGLRVSVVKITF